MRREIEGGEKGGGEGGRGGNWVGMNDLLIRCTAVSGRK